MFGKITEMPSFLAPTCLWHINLQVSTVETSKSRTTSASLLLSPFRNLDIPRRCPPKPNPKLPNQ
ncbi:hypothetical protein M407DRAFT_182766 [Tulasnella calospora MUT 4182]|uniref:Uncharacterized protein n=1 Tax=Tulasnella calospora MUT 4182 TaxID=1051891 RepID=A0A0C3QC86_9AGAM|nr:hypothetical protein M407DRAFT_182766 [Tulasnella calospora MUT 4182]